MKTFIICNGEITDYKYCQNLIEKGDFIICADGGTRHAYNMKLLPNLIMGDLDSSQISYIEYYKNKGVEIIKYPRDKDKTDTHICVLHALEFSSQIILLGALGSRLDHSLANISLLKLGFKKNIPISIEDYQNQVFLIQDNINIKGKPGEFFSLLPLTDTVEGILVKGAQYELSDAKMSIGNPFGISNVFLDEEVFISIKKGYLIIIKSKD